MIKVTEYKIGQRVPIRYFGSPECMKVDEINEVENKVFLRFINRGGMGGSWYSPEELQEHLEWCNNYIPTDLFEQYNQTDCMGNVFSDADNGL